jgi:hypothetical protein
VCVCVCVYVCTLYNPPVKCNVSRVRNVIERAS